MGAVYRARDTSLGRHVALKVLRDASMGNAETTARFLREARISAQLQHPNIVVVYEAAEEGGVPYIAMEWIDGVTLLDAVPRMSLGDRLRVLGELADALAFAHEQGVVHRDVKPTNVLVDQRGRARLADFGIARQTSQQAETFATRDGMILGTPMYMAPEQTASPNVTPAADQFAWGVLAYELLTGHHPRAVVPSFPFQGLNQLSWNVPVAPAVADVVRRAMALEPQHRFPTTRALVEAWSFATSNAASSFAIGPTAGAPIVGQAAPPPKRGLGAVVISVVLLLLCAIVGVIVVLAYKLGGARGNAIPIASSATPVASSVATSAPAPTPSSAPPASPSASVPAPSIRPASLSTSPAKPTPSPTPSAAPTAPAAAGKCLCWPTQYYDDLGSVALCPVAPAFAECRDLGVVVCTGPLKGMSCPNDIHPSTAANGSVCKGVDSTGKPRTGKIIKLCNVNTRVFAGPPGEACKGYTDSGRLVVGKVDCN